MKSCILGAYTCVLNMIIESFGEQLYNSRISRFHLTFFTTDLSFHHHQIMSNDKYTSVEHRVVMNTLEEPRVSIGIFFSPGKRGDSVFYGPLPELVSSENPPKYRNFTMSEFYGTFFSRDLASKALLDNFKM